MNDTAVYCIGGLWLEQHEDNQSCENSFECKSNFCGNGYCFPIKETVDEHTSLLDSILGWFRRMFGHA